MTPGLLLVSQSWPSMDRSGNVGGARGGCYRRVILLVSTIITTSLSLCWALWSVHTHGLTHNQIHRRIFTIY